MSDPRISTFDHFLEPMLRRAYHYGRRWDEALWRASELAAVERMLPIGPPLPVLDLGCGNGDVFETLFGRPQHAYGIDLSDTAIEIARASGRYCEVQRVDACAIPYESGFFRTVFSNSVIEHIQDAGAVIREVHRILRPGGQFCFSTPDALMGARSHYYWRWRLAPFGLDMIGRRMLELENRAYQHVSVFSLDDWRSMLIGCGLEIIAVARHMGPSAMRLMSKYSGAVRVRGLSKLISNVQGDRFFRRAHAPLDEGSWAKAFSEDLRPYLEPTADDGCGLVLLARKPE